jgi:two-component system LytT family sensor kinase
MKRSYFYLLHTIIISIFVVLMFCNVFCDPSYKGPLFFHFLDSFLFYGSLFIITYFSYWLFIPRFLVQKNYWKFYGGLAGIVAGFTLYYYLVALLLSHISTYKYSLMVTHAWLSVGSMAIFLGMAGTFFRLFIQWLQDSYSKLELEKQHFKSELSLLKNQLNPHFLFNTLNNIDSLIIEKSPNASLALNKLSDIMRYMVYDSEKDLVPLQDEIDYLRNYISLQKLRVANEDIINFTVNGAAGSKQVAPMLFIPFVENAFKHSSLKDKPENRIDIRIDIDDNTISFYCSNSIAEIRKDHASGVGMNIIYKRLELIYKGRYDLQIDNANMNYIVRLYIKL